MSRSLFFNKSCVIIGISATVLTFAFSAGAGPRHFFHLNHPHSQHRDSKETFEQARDRYRARLRNLRVKLHLPEWHLRLRDPFQIAFKSEDNRGQNHGPSVEDFATPKGGEIGMTPMQSAAGTNYGAFMSNLDNGAYDGVIPSWSDEVDLPSKFLFIRNTKFFQDNAHHLRRRSSWLYPDDGCFARAMTTSDQLVTTAQLQRPAKLFVFGSLKVQTPNSPTGAVTWWYHVVNFVKWGGQYVVLDPAIDPNHPLSVRQWVSDMGNPSDLTMTVCRGESYVPNSDCGATAVEGDPYGDQNDYLDDEWQRQLDLSHLDSGSPDTIVNQPESWASAVSVLN